MRIATGLTCGWIAVALLSAAGAAVRAAAEDGEIVILREVPPRSATRSEPPGPVAARVRTSPAPEVLAATGRMGAGIGEAMSGYAEVESSELEATRGLSSALVLNQEAGDSAGAAHAAISGLHSASGGVGGAFDPGTAVSGIGHAGSTAGGMVGAAVGQMTGSLAGALGGAVSAGGGR